MGKKPKKSGNISLPPGSPLPPDENVFIPHQIKHAVAIADALATGQPVPPKPEPEPAARPGFPHTDAEISEALQRLQNGKLRPDDREFNIICDLANEGANHIKSRRRGAGQPRKHSDKVKRRRKALLSGYEKLSQNLQKHPTGTETVRRLREFVIKQLNLGDDEVSEDIIMHDIGEVRPLMRLIREKKIPRSFFGNS